MHKNLNIFPVKTKRNISNLQTGYCKQLMSGEQIIAGIFTNLTTFTPWVVDTIAKTVPPEAPASSTKRESSTEEAKKTKKSASVQKVDTDTQLVFTSTSTKAPKYICCF